MSERDAPALWDMGVVEQPPASLLADRARDFLAAGPASSRELIARICQLPGVPAPLAEKLAEDLLGGRREFSRDDMGRWCVANGAPPRLPTFDEWRRERDAGRLAQPAISPVLRSHVPAVAEDVVEPRANDTPVGPRVRRGGLPARAPSTAGARGGPPPETLLHDLSYAVVDVETTGGSPFTGHRITEIAAVTVQNGAIGAVYETLVNPERAIPPMIMKLTGITMEMVRGQAPFHAVCSDVLGALRGHVFVAHNVNFDWRFVSTEISRATGAQLGGPRLCTVRLARKILPQLRSRSLGHVADYYGADEFAREYFENRHGRSRPWRHSAAGDAVATAHCMLRLFRDAEAHGVQTWGALQSLLATPALARPRLSRGRAALPRPVDKDTTA